MSTKPHKLFLLLGVLVGTLFLLPRVSSASIDYDGDGYLPGSYSTTTGLTVTSSVWQSLGTTSALRIGALSYAQFMLSNDGIHTSPTQFILASCNTFAQDPDIGTGCSYLDIATLNVTSATPTVYNFVSSTTIQLSSSKFYSLGLFNTAQPLYIWGGATSTQLWAGGRCHWGATGIGRDCPDQLMQNNGYGDRDIYFNLYGFSQVTRLVVPEPYWAEIVPPTGLSTSTISVGGEFYLNPADSDDGVGGYEVTCLSKKFPYKPLGCVGQVISISTSSHTNDFTYLTLGSYSSHYSIYSSQGGTLLYSSSTSWVLGTVEATSSPFDPGIGDLKTQLDSVSCDITWTNWTLNSIISCVWSYFSVILQYGIDWAVAQASNIFDFIKIRQPFGYLYRIYYILSNPTGQGLPNLIITIPIGLPLAGSSLNLTPWSYIQSASDRLYLATTTNVSGVTSYGGLFEYYMNIILGLIFGFWLVTKVLAQFGHGGIDFSEFGQHDDAEHINGRKIKYHKRENRKYYQGQKYRNENIDE